MIREAWVKAPDVGPAHKRLGWARSLLGQCRAIETALDRDSPPRRDRDPVTGRPRFTVTARPPAAFGFLLADAIHNTRAALDWLAAATVEAAGHDASKNRDVQFPIAKSGNEFEKEIRRRLLNPDPRVVAAIMAAEPWRGGLGAPLHRVHELDIADKHHGAVVAARALYFDSAIYSRGDAVDWGVRLAILLDKTGVGVADVDDILQGEPRHEWVFETDDAARVDSAIATVAVAVGHVSTIADSLGAIRIRGERVTHP